MSWQGGLALGCLVCGAAILSIGILTKPDRDRSECHRGGVALGGGPSHLPTVTPAVVRKASLRLVAFLSSRISPRQDSGLPGDIDDGLGCVRPCKTIGFIWCCRIGIGIAVGGERPGRFLFPACRMQGRLERICGLRPGGGSLNWRWRVARPSAVDGKSSVGEADSNNHDRDRSQHSSVHVHPPCLRRYLSTTLSAVAEYTNLAKPRFPVCDDNQNAVQHRHRNLNPRITRPPQPRGRSLPVDLPSHQRDRLLIDPGGIPGLDGGKIRFARLVAGAGAPAMGAGGNWRSSSARWRRRRDCRCRRPECSWA